VSGPPDLRLFLVEHDLRGLSSQQRSSAHQSLGEAVFRVARRGSRIRYVQRIIVPEESRCLCLFEAAGAELVRNVNDIAQFPLARVVAVHSSVNPSTAPPHRSTAGEDTSDGRH
jgi:Nickel responsive protein SCO4226-like